MIAKLGLDGHDRGARVVAGALSDAGFDVAEGQLFDSVTNTVDLALRQGCDVIGVSTLAGAHLSLVPQLLGELESRHAEIPVVVGGIVPSTHLPMLLDIGVSAVFGPGSRIETVIHFLATVAGTNRQTREGLAIKRSPVTSCAEVSSTAAAEG
jgi:methylmalonyl-CoA mutase